MNNSNIEASSRKARGRGRGRVNSNSNSNGSTRKIGARLRINVDDLFYEAAAGGGGGGLGPMEEMEFAPLKGVSKTGAANAGEGVFNPLLAEEDEFENARGF